MKMNNFNYKYKFSKKVYWKRKSKTKLKIIIFKILYPKNNCFNNN